MRKTGMWSAEDQRAVVPGRKRPLAPPAELDEPERVIWASIVAKLPGDWFAPESVPLLQELCRHIRNANELTGEMGEIRDEIAVLAKGFDPVVMGSDVVEGRKEARAKLRSRLHSLMRDHGYQSERIGNLATKLRLTNQAKIVVSAAARKASDTPKGPLPWDDWGLPERTAKQ
jgi:hypothetical protein